MKTVKSVALSRMMEVKSEIHHTPCISIFFMAHMCNHKGNIDRFRRMIHEMLPVKEEFRMEENDIVAVVNMDMFILFSMAAHKVYPEREKEIRQVTIEVAHMFYHLISWYEFSPEYDHFFFNPLWEEEVENDVKEAVYKMAEILEEYKKEETARELTMSEILDAMEHDGL